MRPAVMSRTTAGVAGAPAATCTRPNNACQASPARQLKVCTLSGIDTTLDVGVFLTVPRLPVLTSSAGILKVLLLDILVN
jgi:hypothetical protein